MSKQARQEHAERVKARKQRERTEREQRTDERKSPYAQRTTWPPLPLRLLLWPFANFDWRIERDRRVRTTRFTQLSKTPLKDYDSKPVVPNFPVYLRSDGKIRADFDVRVQMNDVADHDEESMMQKRSHIVLKRHDRVFEIVPPQQATEVYDMLMKPLIRKRIPVVSSDGWFVKIRNFSGKTDRVFTYWDYWDEEREAAWFEWMVEPIQAGYHRVLFSGWKNYQLVGMKCYRWSPLILFALFIMFLWLSVYLGG